MRDTPEPPYRQQMRETAAQLEGTLARLNSIHLDLGSQVIEAPAGAEWAPLAGIPGLESRLIPGAFVLETRAPAGTVCNEVAVPQGVDVYVRSGVFSLRRLDTEPAYTTYPAGSVIALLPNQRHAWRVLERCENRIAFIPAEYYTLATPT